MHYTLPLLLSISTFSVSHAHASEFYAVINNLGAIAADGSTSTETGVTGFATFTLDQPAVGSPTLTYDLRFTGADFMGDTDPTNDVTAIHLHDTTGVSQSAGTPHVLNIFGFPSQDDDQMVVDAVASRVTGVWDDSDLTDPGLPHAGNPGPNSDTLTSMLDALMAGELYVMLHTTSPDALPGGSGITVGGRILPVPEPTAAVLALVAFTLANRRRG